MAANKTPRFAEMQRLQTQTGLTSNFSLNDLRTAYYGGKVSQNDGIRAYLQSQLSNTTTQSVSDLWRLFFISKGVTNQVSLGDMARDFFFNVGFSPAVTPHSAIFNGSTNFGLITHHNLDGLVAGTVEFWFKTSYGAGYQKFFKDNGTIDIGISQDFGGGAQVFAEIVNVANPGTFSGTVNDGTWHHIAISWNATDLKTFEDGVLKTTTASAGTQATTTNDMNCGNAPGPAEYFNGKWHEIRFSNIKRYNASFTPQTSDFTTDANTLALIHFNDQSATLGTDASSNGNNIVYSSAPTYSTDTPY